MIRIDRKNGPPPEVVVLAQEEEGKNKGMKKSDMVFKVYSDRRIKAALHQLFHGKCAYCESKIQGTQPIDVEHWRPKSIYWFLAADWKNLYPSCIDCNRRREHLVPLPDGTAKSIVLGKHDQFPISGAKPAEDRDSLSGEDPLLLDPCVDDGEKFFEFTPEGVIRSKVPHPRSEESIRVYALNRMGLVHERYERRLLLERHFHRIRQLAKAMEEIEERQIPHPNDNELRAILDDLILFEKDALRVMCGESQPYAAQARQLVDRFFNSADGLTC